MINVTRFNDTNFIVNAELIQTIEETPDTVITLTNGIKFIVKESSAEIRKRVIEYKREIFLALKENL